MTVQRSVPDHQEWVTELRAHIEQLNKNAADGRRKAKRGKNYPEQSFWGGVASSYEIEVAYLEGFVRRHTEPEVRTE
jgi:hypothetical protein